METFLGIDEQTIRDLEVFESPSGAQTLYNYCNRTCTEGGARVLKQRLQQPWCRAADIKATQDALAFITLHRDLFERIQSQTYTASRVDQYLREILPVLTQQNALEFGLEVINVRMNHDSHYTGIARGVQFCTRLVASLADLAADELIPDAPGDLQPLLIELRELLSRPALAAVTVLDAGDWSWKVLRFDQVFRFSEKQQVMRLLDIIYELDALTAMADTNRDCNLTTPEILDGAPQVHAEDLYHPFIQDAVPNPVDLTPDRRVLFLTGPNMAGKTTYLRSFATAIYFAHLGLGVPARQFRFVPTRHLFSSISLHDNLQEGVSYFRAEALRVKDIARAIAAGDPIIAVLDEPFKGTNVKDAFDASLAILERFSRCKNSLFMFSSHLLELSESLSSRENVDCRFFDALETHDRLAFNYQLQRGISDQRLGMRVLEEEGIFELLDGAV